MERGVKIPHNLETTALQIKTDSIKGSQDVMRLWFYSAEEKFAGRLFIYFYALKYRIDYCTPETAFPSSLPSEDSKVWQISKLSGPRIIFHCNDVKVADILMSEATCTGPLNSYWRERYSTEIGRIVFKKGDDFESPDTASDFYQADPPGDKIKFII